MHSHPLGSATSDVDAGGASLDGHRPAYWTVLHANPSPNIVERSLKMESEPID